jgi:hypothetical protein
VLNHWFGERQKGHHLAAWVKPKIEEITQELFASVVRRTSRCGC